MSNSPVEDVARVREAELLEALARRLAKLFHTFELETDYSGIRLDLALTEYRPRDLANKLREIADYIGECQR